MHIAVQIRNSAVDSTGSLLPENRLLPLHPSLGNSCGSCRVCVHPRIARAATSATRGRRRRRRRSRRTQRWRHIAADIYEQFRHKCRNASLFSSSAGHACDAIRIHRRVISPRDILMPALVNDVAKQRDVTELHYSGGESAFVPAIAGC